MGVRNERGILNFVRLSIFLTSETRPFLRSEMRFAGGRYEEGMIQD